MEKGSLMEEVDVVEEEAIVEEADGLKTRRRRRKDDDKSEVEAANGLVEKEQEEKVAEEGDTAINGDANGEHRSVYYDPDQGVWKCWHCTWTYRLIGPRKYHIHDHEGYCQVVMDDKSLILLESFSGPPNKAAGVALADDVAVMKPKEVDAVAFQEELVNGKPKVSYAQGSIQTEANPFLKNMNAENGSSSHCYSEVQNEETKNENEIEEHEQITIVKKSKLKVADFDLERVLKEQDTHDLYCPNCNSCITRRVILRKRKRSTREFQSDAPTKKVHEEHVRNLDASSAPSEMSKGDDEEPDVFRCLSCFSFFIPTETGYNIFRMFEKKEEKQVQNSEENSERKVGWISSIFNWEKSDKKARKSGYLVQHEKESSSMSILGSAELGEKKSIAQKVDAEAGYLIQHKEESSSSTTVSGSAELGVNKSTVQKNEAEAGYLIQHKEESSSSTTVSGSAELGVNKSTVQKNEAEAGYLIQHKEESSSSTTVSGSAELGVNKSTVQKNEAEAGYLIQHKEESSSSTTVLGSAELGVNKSTVQKNEADILQQGVSNIRAQEIMEDQAEYNKQSTQFESPSEVILHIQEQAVVSDVFLKNDSGNDTIMRVSKVISKTDQIIHTSASNLAVTSSNTEVQLGIPGQSNVDAGRKYEWDILKSIVYGGLIESITSLSIVSSAAGANASTFNVVAIGLANLFGGFLLVTHDLLDLRSVQAEDSDQKVERAGRYWELLGWRRNFRRHFFVSMTSYILVGLLPPVVYGFSFRKSDIKEYKLIAVAAASFLCIALLAIGKAHVKPQKPYFRTLFYYICLGLSASGLSYVAGVMINRLLAELGLFDHSSAPVPPSLDINWNVPAMASY